MLFYLDTCIYLDFIENRFDKLRPLGSLAEQAIKVIFETRSIIVYSELILYEFSKHSDHTKLENFFEDLKLNKHLMKIEITAKHKEFARKLVSEFDIPYADALHTALASSVNATLITRDSHFASISHLIQVKLPKQI